MDKKYAIFDMDGTLVDSMGCWNRILEEYLHGHGVTQVPQELLDRTAVMTTRETLGVFIREFDLQDTPEQAEQRLLDLMTDHYRKDVPLKPGVKGYLTALRERGVAMCVVSATPLDMMELCLRRLGVRDMFRFILSCEQIGVGKERPDIYFAAAERLGVEDNASAAVYEDALSACRTAKGAGFYVVGVQDDNAAAGWEEIKALADEVLERWE